MHQHQLSRIQRLGLLLAGGGRRCRRLVAQIDPEPPALDGLRSTGAPQALLTTARHLSETEAPRLLERLDASGWRWLTPGDPELPEVLLHCSDPPLGLFVRGRIPAGLAMAAIVGSRACTPYGKQVAHLLGEESARAGIPVVSGMAQGIDAAAHQGSLQAGGPTLAVWGTGPDQIYPSQHRRLADSIAENGALLTEYPPGTPPRRHHFPERNRIIAGLARAVVIVEAAVRSGALITARLALEEGREVLAVPGSIFSEQSLGPNALLRHGARPLLTVRDLLDELGEAGAAGDDPTTAAQAEDDSGLLRYLPRGEARSVDELAELAELPVYELLPQLLDLELAASVERLADGRYSRMRAGKQA